APHGLLNRRWTTISEALQDLPLAAIRVERIVLEKAPQLLLKRQSINSNGAARPSTVRAQVPFRRQDNRNPSRISVGILFLKLGDQPDCFTTVVIDCLRATLDDRKHGWLPPVSRYVH